MHRLSASRTLAVAVLALSLFRSVESSAFLMSPTSRSKGAVIVGAGSPCDPLRQPVAEPLEIEPGGKLPVTYFGDDVGIYEFVLTEAANENILDSLDRNSDEALYYREDTYSLPPGNAFHTFNVRLPPTLQVGQYILQMRSRRYRSCSDLIVSRNVPFESSVIALITVGGAGIVFAIVALIFFYRKRGGCLLSDGSLIVSRTVDDDKPEEGIDPIPPHTQVRMPEPGAISPSVADTQRPPEFDDEEFSEGEEEEEEIPPSIRTCFTPSSAAPSASSSPGHCHVISIGSSPTQDGPIPSQQRLPPTAIPSLPAAALTIRSPAHQV